RAGSPWAPTPPRVGPDVAAAGRPRPGTGPRWPWWPWPTIVTGPAGAPAPSSLCSQTRRACLGPLPRPVRAPPSVPPTRHWEPPLMRLRILVPLLVLAGFAAVVPAFAMTLEREVRIDPSRLVLSRANGLVALEARAGTHEYGAGRPDLPWISERVDLPAGMKLTRVDVVSAATELVADGVRPATTL